MPERAHPKDFPKPGSLQFRLRRGFVPWVSRVRDSPFYDEFHYRYQWANNLVKNMKVLEIPCGVGWGTSLMTKAKSITAIDISQDAINEARRLYLKSGEFCVGDMASIAADDASYDAVVCLEGIEHVPISVADMFIEEAHRVLRPNGILLISSPHAESGGHSGNEFHIHEYRPDEIAAKLERRFVIKKSHSRRVERMIVTYFECRRPSD